MKILMINKFLYPNGGSETYVIKLGEALSRLGHEVEYFGMEHEGRILGNSANAYTRNMDFHNAGISDKLIYPIKTIYSFEARRKIRQILEKFDPEVCHINNFNYQLTPSIIIEIDRWRRKKRKGCRIVYTAHDLQLVCPSHQGYIPNTKENCLKCLGGKYGNCTKNRCIHGSLTKSAIGTLEAWYWNRRRIYRLLDTIICCSEFMKRNLDTNPILAGRTVAIHNFLPRLEKVEGEKENYVLYFGRYSYEKGVLLLLEACKRLSDINFVFAGRGDYEDEMKSLPNVRNVGFTTGKDLYSLIGKARFSICPSIAYENCPYSVMESIALGTPVVGSDVGGIPELIEEGVTGRVFKGNNVNELTGTIRDLWDNRELTDALSKECHADRFYADEKYCEAIMKYYR